MKLAKFCLAAWSAVLFVFGGKAAGVLPEGYTAEAWIESSGNQWVNTGIVPNATDRVEMEFLFPGGKATAVDWHCLFCARDTGNKNTFTTFWGGMQNSGKFRVDRNATTGGASGPVIADNVRYVLSLDYGTRVASLTADGAATTAPAFPNDTGTFTAGSALALFASHSAGSGLNATSAMSNLAQMRLYSFRLLDANGTARAELVPCRNSSGVAGLYDTARDLFLSNSGTGVFATSEEACYAKPKNGSYVYYNQSMTEVAAPAGGLDDSITLVFSTEAEYQALVTAPEDVARAKGVALANDVVLTANTDWSALEFDMNDHVITLVGCNLKVASLLGTGTVTSSGSVIANGSFTTDPIPAGATRTGTITPKGWKGTGIICKNDTSYTGHQLNGVVWFRIPQGGNISQTFTIAQAGTYRLSYATCASNPQSGTTSYATCDARIDGTSVQKNLKMGWAGTNGNSVNKDITVGAGTHTFALYSTKEGGANYGTPIVKTVALYPTKNYKNATSILEVAVPEGVVTTNANVTIAGGASMRVWKTGKGALVLEKVNDGFGAANAIAGWESLVVKEGTVYKTGNGATIGTQYSRIAVNDGGQLDIGGRTYWDYDYELSGAGPDGLGALVNTTPVTEPWASSKVGYLRHLTLVGDATIGGTQPWGMIFYDYGANTATLNGHTLTYSGTMLYGGLLSYSDTGRIVVDEGAQVEFCTKTPTAGGVDLEVRGILQQHDMALSPVNALRFTATGSYNNPWTTRPAFVVQTVYAPNVNTETTSAVLHPTVQLGAAGHLETTLDLSLFATTFDATSTSFFGGSFVTVELGAREVAVGDKLVSWSEPPTGVQFSLAGENIASVQLYAAADGLYLRGQPTFATLDPTSGTWSFFGANGQPYPGEWEEGVTPEIDVYFSTLAEYEAILEAAVTPRRYVMTALTLTGPTDLSQGFPFTVARHTIIDLKGYSLKLPPVSLTGSLDLTITDTVGGYDYLDSIQSSGTQWIDTGFICSNATRLDAKFNTLTRTAAWSVFFGVTSNDSNADGIVMRYYNATDQLTGWFCAGANINGATGMSNKDVEVVLAKDTMIINGIATPLTTTGSPYQKSLYLFCGNNGGSAWRHQAMKLYSFKITEADELVRDFVPVRRHRDGAIGLLDRVNNVFYANMGSGTFVSGEVTSSVVGGKLRVEVPEGETVTLGAASATLTGELKLVKEGAGSLVTSRTQTYAGGTDVKGGTLKWGDAYPGAYLSPVTVFEGGVYDLGGHDNANSRPVLAGGTFINTVKDIGNGLAQNAVIAVTADSTADLAFTTGLIGSSYAATTLDLGGHTLDLSIASGKSFWLYNAAVTAGTLKLSGAGTLAIDKTSVRAAEADFDLGCNATVAVATEVHDWIVREGVTVGGAGTITINGSYKPIGDSVSSYLLKDGTTFDLSGRSEMLDLTAKKVTFADDATIYVKAPPQKSGLIVAWTEPANFSTLTFLKAPGETGTLTATSAGLVYIRGLTIFFR